MASPPIFRPNSPGHADSAAAGVGRRGSSARAPGADAGSRDKIFEAAEALFARSGYAGVGMREVAEHVGLSKSSLFHHFPTKLGLYSEALGRAIDRLADRMRPVLQSDLDAATMLDRSVDALIDFLTEDPSAPRLSMRALFEDDPFVAEGRNPEPFEFVLLELIGGFEALLQRGIDSGALRAVSIPDTIQSLIGMTVYHFASGEFGDGLFGHSIFSADAVLRRRSEVKQFMRRAVLAEPGEFDPNDDHAGDSAPG